MGSGVASRAEQRLSLVLFFHFLKRVGAQQSTRATAGVEEVNFRGKTVPAH